MTWPTPQHTTSTETTRYGTAAATSWDRVHPRLTHRGSPCWPCNNTGEFISLGCDRWHLTVSGPPSPGTSHRL
jgi:hypothetical protein